MGNIYLHLNVLTSAVKAVNGQIKTGREGPLSLTAPGRTYSQVCVEFPRTLIFALKQTISATAPVKQVFVLK